MEIEFNRRTVLVGSTIAAASVAGFFASKDTRRLAADFIKHSLPGVTIDEASLMLCADDYLSGVSQTEFLAAKASWSLVGVEGMASVHPKFARSARNLLTLFLAHSNFFWLKDPTSEVVVYRQPVVGQACGNPFANLSPPDPDVWPVVPV